MQRPMSLKNRLQIATIHLVNYSPAIRFPSNSLQEVHGIIMQGGNPAAFKNVGYVKCLFVTNECVIASLRRDETMYCFEPMQYFTFSKPAWPKLFNATFQAVFSLVNKILRSPRSSSAKGWTGGIGNV
jgi:hypothetical protein